MKWRIIQPTSDDYTEKEKEAVVSLEGPDGSNDVCIYCHVDGRKHMIGWFRQDGSFSMMSHSDATKRKLQSVGFDFDDNEVRVK